MKRAVAGVTLECVEGNIVRQPDMMAVVNAANAQLLPGGGVAGAIHHAAGPGLERECRPLAPIKPGEAVITGGHNLPNKYVIHCLGPVYTKDQPSDKLLGSCYRNALTLCEEYEIASVAFPAISTGAFGYPLQQAAEVAFKVVIDMAPTLKAVKHIRFVLYSNGELAVHEQVLERLTSDRGMGTEPEGRVDEGSPA